MCAGRGWAEKLAVGGNNANCKRLLMTDSGYLVYQIIGTVFFYLFIFIKFFKLFFKNIYLFNYFLTLIISFRAPIVLHFWAVPRQL